MNALERNLKYLAPVARLALGLMFLMAGINKITGFSGTVGYMEAYGMPAASVFAVLALLVEVLGSLALITGWQGRWAALLLAGFLVPVTLIFHTDWSAQAEMMAFMKNLSMFGGLLMVAVNGPGPYSLGKDPAGAA